MYNFASHQTLKKLDSIHHHAIRIAVGAFRTSPIIDILSETMEVPLKIRRTHLSIKFALTSLKTLLKQLSTERSYHHTPDEKNRTRIL